MVKPSLTLNFDTFEEFEAVAAILKREFGPKLFEAPEETKVLPAPVFPQMTTGSPPPVMDVQTEAETPLDPAQLFGVTPATMPEGGQPTVVGGGVAGPLGVAQTGENATTPEGATPQPVSSPEVDTDGVQYNPELHATPASKTKSGHWRKRRTSKKTTEKAVETPAQIGGSLINTPAQPQIEAPSASEYADLIRDVQSLKDAGILTQQWVDAKTTELNAPFFKSQIERPTFQKWREAVDLLMNVSGFIAQ